MKMLIKKDKTKKIFIHYGKIFFTYRIKEKDFFNKNAKEDWHIKEYWSIFIGINKKWFKYEDAYYDGMTNKNITILGLNIGLNYEYVSRSIQDWLKNVN